MPETLQKALDRLDEFGLDKLASAPYVKLTLQESQGLGPSRTFTRNGWQLAADKDTLTVLEEGVQPQVYNLKGFTVVPESWNPDVVELKAIATEDFEEVCKKLANTPRPTPEELLHTNLLHSPGPSYRFLVAYAAWKKGMTTYCESLVTHDRGYEGDMDAFVGAAYDDLSWIQFLRGVNLLMYADRRKAVDSLRLASRLSPEGDYAAQAQDLVKRLTALVEAPAAPQKVEPAAPGDKAKLYIAQLKDLHCIQMSQPGDIEPYIGILVTESTPPPERWDKVLGGPIPPQLPTTKLKAMGFDAVPALVDALGDDTPTRTVYHWRDFHHSRTVWRVSDFAYRLLREITKRDLGYQNSTGFTFSYMKPEEKEAVRAEVRQWYTGVRNMSEDDRMFTLFKSNKLDDWMTAGKYFAAKGDKQAVKPLLEKLPLTREYRQGDLCELIARFGDRSAIAPIRKVLDDAPVRMDRLGAAIALWDLGDDAGVPVAIRCLIPEGRDPDIEEPVWFLMRTRRPDAIRALQDLVVNGGAERAGNAILAIDRSITGDLFSRRRQPAGCVEICPVLIAGMEVTDKAGAMYNDVRVRVKDLAAQAFAALRAGPGAPGDPPSWMGFSGNNTFFNILEPDEAKRDAQIAALKKWYEDNKDRLTWDDVHHRLALKPAPGAEQ